MFFSFFCNNISCTHHSKWLELQQIELRPKYGSDINFMSFTSLAKTGLLCKYESTRVEIRTSREGGGIECSPSIVRRYVCESCIAREFIGSRKSKCYRQDELKHANGVRVVWAWASMWCGRREEEAPRLQENHWFARDRGFNEAEAKQF